MREQILKPKAYFMLQQISRCILRKPTTTPKNVKTTTPLQRRQESLSCILFEILIEARI